jgi:hypothetical protein
MKILVIMNDNNNEKNSNNNSENSNNEKIMKITITNDK